MFAEQNLAAEIKGLAHLTTHPQLLPEPRLHRSDECAAGARVCGGVTSHDSLEFEQRLFVENDVVELIRLQTSGFEAVVRGVDRQAGVVFGARKALFFGRGNELTI